MDRGHDPVYHAYVIMQHLDYRGQAVGRAGGVGDDGVRFLQYAVVDAVNDGRIHVLAAGRGDDDFFCSPGKMGGGLCLAGEKPGGFMDDVHAQFAPGQLCRVPFRQDAYAVAVDHHVIAIHLNRSGKLAVGGIVAGQVRVGLGIAEVIDRDNADLVSAPALVQRPQNVSADPAVAVDSYVYSHYV